MRLFGEAAKWNGRENVAELATRSALEAAPERLAAFDKRGKKRESGGKQKAESRKGGESRGGGRHVHQWAACVHHSVRQPTVNSAVSSVQQCAAEVKNSEECSTSSALVLRLQAD